MELSPFVEGLRRELSSLTRFASDDVVQVVDRLGEALDSSVRLMLLDVLSAAAAEITTRLDDTVIDVRLSAGEPDFVVTDVPPPHATRGAGPAQDSTADDAGTARVTLRLSDALKTRVEAQAAADGLSVNSWLAHAAIRALEDSGSARGQRSRSGIGQRIIGYARS
jgi:predicted transcriptional regulator